MTTTPVTSSTAASAPSSSLAAIAQISAAAAQKKTEKAAAGKPMKKITPQVQLIKLKMQAKGDREVPPADRFYIMVYVKKTSAVVDFKLYFDQFWKIGRVLDRVAEIAGLRNDNNMANAEKLGLYHGDTGKKLANHLSLNHADHQLENGSSVIVERGLEDVVPGNYLPQ